MAATANEIAEWLMLARDRILDSSGSFLAGSADVFAAGELLARLADALGAWDSWREQLVVDDAARARRILAAAAFRCTPAVLFRQFVADNLDATFAQRLGEKEIAQLVCAVHLKRRGRPKKQEDLAVRYIKTSLGLAADEEIPDKVEALQRLGSTIGIPRISPEAVEDQIGPLLARMAEIRREREAMFADLQKEGFKSHEDAVEAFEDADIQASVMEDEAVRSAGSRPKRKPSPPVAKKRARRRASGNSRRTR